MSELLHVLTDPAHILAEVVMELASYLIFGVIFAKWILRRHDQKVHPRVTRIEKRLDAKEEE